MSPPMESAPDDYVYPTGLKLAALMTSMYIGMFLVALVSWMKICLVFVHDG
jgi:hypothetical protein